VDEPTRGLEYQIHGLIGLIYEAAMDVDLWPMLLRTLGDLMDQAEPEAARLAAAVNAEETLFAQPLPEAPGEGRPLALTLVELIRPHFSRALDLNRRLGRQRRQNELFARLLERFPLALAVVSLEGEVLQNTPRFDQLLSDDRRLLLQQGRLCFTDREAQLAWREACGRLAEGAETSATIALQGREQSPLSAMLFAFSDAQTAGPLSLLLSLAAPGLMGRIPERELAAMFSLTPAEARLLAALVNGYSLEEYSETVCVSRNTARSHLKALFQKTGTHRQGELVRQVLSSPALLTGDNAEESAHEVCPVPRDAQRLKQGIRLADGRWLSYAEYGPRHGRPLLFAHGLTGCRLQAHPDESLLYRLGVRLLVPDRPGFGLSDFDSRRTVLDWAGDIRQLLDALQLEQVAAMGFSVGGIFAMALGRALGERIAHLTLVSSMGRYHEAADLDGMIPRNRMILLLGRHMPAILTPFMQLMIDSLRRNPQQYFDDLLRNLPAFERHYLRHPAMRDSITRAFLEATRNGVQGLVYEQMLISRPWEFTPSQVKVPVRLWHGEQDVHVPIAMSRQLAHELPRCESHLLQDSGHFLLYDRMQEILATMVSEGPGSAAAPS
jgi:pimeloyl-ACP methyl ester carboxylesterase/DNA-binding CsgD family transcriptional regulator